MRNELLPFFHIDDNFMVANDSARSPWAADACHAGPPTGLFARAAEQRIADKQLVRLTVNYVRPVPMSGVRIQTDVLREGRIATALSLSMIDREDRVCAHAMTTHIVKEEVDQLPTPPRHPPATTDETPRDFVFSNAPHGQPFFANFVETRYAPGFEPGPGPKTIWMRTPALIEGESMSPFQSVCPLADCGNGVSFNAHPREVSCINPDISLTLHRLPESEWLASSAISHWEPTGIGMSHATLHDESGEIGVATQSLFLRHL